ncbi:MAG: AAA family ATPase [Candidatus Thiodiazotropha sp.]
MKIDFLEIEGFRKLQSCRIDFDDKKTLLVGANNSGKTSAMVALRKFLLQPKAIEVRDISIRNWCALDKISDAWESGDTLDNSINDFLPRIDIWLDVPITEIYHVVHIIPNAEWKGGHIGISLQYVTKDIDILKADYLKARETAKKIEDEAPEDQKPSVTPSTLVEFLEGSTLSNYLTLKAYSLDPAKLVLPDNKGIASLQSLPGDVLEIEGYPFQSLINIRVIPAERSFVPGSGASSSEEDMSSERFSSTLSDHVRNFYDTHIDKTEDLNPDDINAFSALQLAERAFDKKLKTGFSDVFAELSDLGIPGINNPSIEINTKFRSHDGLNHKTAIQYKVSEPEEGKNIRYLPESYAGLGYQNLIAMVFLLMRFRQDWIDPKTSIIDDTGIAPLQLVMIEEPEAHLHAQVQQVFIKKAYDVLRNHPDLRETSAYTTQLLVSTHSSHVAHEVDFANIRYFRRHPAEKKGLSPISTVINLSHVFGKDEETLRFVKRYIKATDCDLFFADGAIFVEGQSERILVPHFIRFHFSDLWRRYISLIDLGGANAPRFTPLIKALGLTSLVITDLDAGKSTEVELKKGGKTTRIKKAKPKLGDNQVSTNPTLKKWHPKLDSIDKLIALKKDDHEVRIEDEYDLYVSYQTEVEDSINADNEKIIPRTFEDAMVYENHKVLKEISGSATTNKIADLLKEDLSKEDLEAAIFEIIDSAEKAAFAIDCLVTLEQGEKLMPPPYIASGLDWLQKKLQDNNTMIDGIGDLVDA